MNNKIMILDGNSLLFRAFYAMPPLKTKKGQYTNGVYGFLSMLYKLEENYAPDYLCVAFDPKKPTFRHDRYKDYKAGRAKAPNELVEQFTLIREVLDIHNIKCVEIEGFEADDVAGTLACEAKGKGAEVLLVTSDRDYLQLIDNNIRVLLTKKGVTNTVEMDMDKIDEEYGIKPKQFVDLKALMGDASDNIPGVAGVGEKTALKLIKEYGSLDNVYENIDEIKGKLKERLETDKIQAYMSQTLAKIITDIPVDFDLEEFKMSEPDNDKLRELYDDLEFKNFKKRIKNTTEQQADRVVNQPLDIEVNKELQISMFDTEVEDSEGANKSDDIIYIDEKEKLDEIKKSILKSKKIAVKFLLDNDRALFGEAIALGISSCDGNVYYVDFEKINKDEALEVLKYLFESEDICKIGHLLKNEVIYLMKNNIVLNNISFDSQIGKYLLNPSDSSYSIEKLTYEYLDAEHLSENEYLGTGKKRLSFKDLDLGKRENYIFNYLNTVIKAEDKITQEIEELKMTNLFKEIELPLIEVLAYMEYEGFKVDNDVLDKLGIHFNEELAKLEDEIYNESGEKFNINSPKQLSVVLFEHLALPVIKKTKTGISTDVEVLEKLKDSHPVINKIIEYRQLSKLNSTYVEGLKAVTDKSNSRVHSVFNQTITTTGRISSTEPNLQNIPTRSDEGKELRKAFVAEDGFILVDADYSQIELRVLAHLANEANLIESFENHEDIHTKTASEVFKVPVDEVTPVMRGRAKAVNFGIVYGISDYGLSRDLNIPRKEAKVYIDNYLEYYSNIDKYMKDIIEDSKAKGYVETYFQRRRYIPELQSRNFNIRSFGERVALNTPVQGTAADIIKAAMVSVYKKLKEKNMKSRLILQVHDELIIEACKDEEDEVKNILKTEMENVVQDFKVTLAVDISVGDSWYEAK